MAWHSSVRLGCAIQRCPQFYVVVCQYGPGGNIIGEAIYDVGPTCSRCPTGTSCEQATGLCSTSASPTPSATNTVTIPPATDTVATPPATALPSNTCPDNSGMTETLRRTFLNRHNELRSSLAKGTGAQRNGPREGAPPASNMEEMRYDCSLEAAAIRHALTCDGELSPLESRPNAKENIQKVNNLALDYTTAANQAMTTWWSELAQSYVRSDMLFDSETRHRTSNIVTHWSKMAWHDNVRLGCAVQRCHTFYFVVCQYSPGGNIVGDYVYNVAAVCSACPVGTSCNATTALCVQRS